MSLVTTAFKALRSPACYRLTGRCVTFFLAVLAMLILIWTPAALAWRGTVENVNACDSIVISANGTGEKKMVSLYGVRCPVPGSDSAAAQPWADEATALLANLLPKGLPIVIHDMKMDIFGRPMGSFITLSDGKQVQEHLIDAGLAWVYPHHCGNCRQWVALQNAAKEARRGVWSDHDPVEPWKWAPQTKTSDSEPRCAD